MRIAKNKLAVFGSLLLILVIAATVLFYRIGDLLDKVSLDEWRLGYFSANLNGAPYVPYFVKHDAYNDNHPTLLLYQTLFSYKVFGPNIFALRFFSVFYGFLTVVTFYFIIERIVRKKLRFYRFFGPLLLVQIYYLQPLGN